MYSRHDEIEDAFLAFHKEHPEFWDMFVQFTKQAMDRGFKTFGSKAVFERIRWDTAVPTKDDETCETKLQNSFHAFYARLFMEEFPEHKGYFETRFQPSTLKPAKHPVDPLW